MKLLTYIAFCGLLMTLAMFVDAMPSLQMAGLPSKVKREKTEVLPTSTTTSEEDHFGEGWGLTSSFGVEEDDSGEISQGPKSSSPILTRPTDAPRSGGKQGAHTYSALNDTDHQQEKKGRKRVRRRCSPGHFGCRRPTKAPPKRVRH